MGLLKLLGFRVPMIFSHSLSVSMAVPPLEKPIAAACLFHLFSSKLVSIIGSLLQLYSKALGIDC